MRTGSRGGLDLVGSKEVRRYGQGTSELRAAQVSEGTQAGLADAATIGWQS